MSTALHRGSFVIDGFLSDDMQRTISAARAEFQDWFALAEDVSRLGLNWLHNKVPPLVVSNRQLLAATLLLRGMQTYQAAILLAERGIAAETTALARILSETAIAMGSAEHDDAFVERLEEDHYCYKRKIADAMLKHQPTASELNESDRATLEEGLREIERRYGKRKLKAIKWEQQAEKAKMTDLYLLIYRSASASGIHVSATALEKLIGTTPDGRIQHLRFGPDLHELDRVLSAAISSILHLLSVLPRLFDFAEGDAELAAMVARYRSLVK